MTTKPHRTIERLQQPSTGPLANNRPAKCSSSSEYARFYKCDLQVQTPEDPRNWDADDPVRVGNPRDEADLQDKARLQMA
jgi:hypothetical protein